MERQGVTVAEIDRPTSFGCLLRGAGCLLLVAVATAILLPALARSGSGHRFSCANNMKSIGLGLKMYSNEEPGEQMPPLPAIPGRLAFPVDAFYPVYLPEPAQFICPQAPEFETLGIRVKKDGDFFTTTYSPKINSKTIIADWSYFYLGYAVSNDQDIERFAAAYRQHMASGTPMTADITEANDPNGERTIYRLAEGVERKLLARFGRSPDNPGDSARTQSNIPILIERIGHHTGKRSGRKYTGANILYLDGHVEFIEYPGKWPMTEKTVRILNELDALGGAAVAR